MQKVCLCVRKEIYAFFYLCLVYIFESLKPLAMITGLHFLTDPVEGLGAMDTQNKDLLLFGFCLFFYGKVVQKEGASRVALVLKNPPAKSREVRNTGSIPGSGRSPGGGHGNPLQYSCLENSRGRGAWQATVHRVTKSWTGPKQLSTLHSTEGKRVRID